ncbi:MAG TPA: type II secretion system protein [Acidimicrobiia bacterium]
MRARNTAGETLVELCIAIVIMGAVVAAYFGAWTTAGTASKSARDLVTADAILRTYAESTKSAVRDGCATSSASTPSSTFTVTYPDTLPTAFAISSSPSLTNQGCPGVTAVLPVTLTVTLPSGHTKSLDIAVRTP